MMGGTMAQWGTPEYNAEMHRQQLVRDAQFKQQQENNARFAAAQKAREAQQAQQREAQAKSDAFSAGLNGDAHSSSKYTHYGSYISGAAAGMRDPHTGKSWFEKPKENYVVTTPVRSYSTEHAAASSQGTSGWFGWIALTVFLAALFFLASKGEFSNNQSMAVSTVPSSTNPVSPGQVLLEPFTHYVTAQNLNIRKGPGTEFKVLGTQSRNNCIRVVGNAQGSWVRVAVPTSWGPMEYYASGRYLRPLSRGDTCS